MNRCHTFAVFALFAGSLSLSAQQGAAGPAPDAASNPPSSLSATDGAGSSAQTETAKLQATSPNYIVGDEDIIQVTVWKEPTLSGNLVVRPDGMVSVPLLGDVKAAGLTPMALGRNLTDRLSQYIKDPLVTVTVVAVNSAKVYLIGEIARPGPLVISPGMSLLQAISSAGGLTPYANAKHIYILRGPSGKQRKIPFNYKKAFKKGDDQGVKLTAGDTIVVP